MLVDEDHNLLALAKNFLFWFNLASWTHNSLDLLSIMDPRHTLPSILNLFLFPLQFLTKPMSSKVLSDCWVAWDSALWNIKFSLQFSQSRYSSTIFKAGSWEVRFTSWLNIGWDCNIDFTMGDTIWQDWAILFIFTFALPQSYLDSS